MNRFRVRKTDDTLIILVPSLLGVPDHWTRILELDRVWAANLAAELDAWLSGTDEIPTLEGP